MAGPVIGVCACRERARWAFWDQTAHLVADSYVAAVQAAGAVVVLLPVDARVPETLLDRIDALLLIGGADLDPASYGADRDPATETSYSDRDAFELALTRRALERSLPFLGICRGMQILNVACGGTLRQNLHADGQTSHHRRAIGSFDGTENEIALDAHSLVARALGRERHIGHCHHHQAIDRLGRGLTITGRAVRDGVPEAIEASDGAWTLGVQWHPEASDDLTLFAALADAAEARQRAGASGIGNDDEQTAVTAA